MHVREDISTHKKTRRKVHDCDIIGYCVLESVRFNNVAGSLRKKTMLPVIFGLVFINSPIGL